MSKRNRKPTDKAVAYGMSLAKKKKEASNGATRGPSRKNKQLVCSNCGFISSESSENDFIQFHHMAHDNPFREACIASLYQCVSTNCNKYFYTRMNLNKHYNYNQRCHEALSRKNNVDTTETNPKITEHSAFSFFNHNIFLSTDGSKQAMVDAFTTLQQIYNKQLEKQKATECMNTEVVTKVSTPSIHSPMTSEIENHVTNMTDLPVQEEILHFDQDQDPQPVILPETNGVHTIDETNEQVAVDVQIVLENMNNTTQHGNTFTSSSTLLQYAQQKKSHENCVFPPIIKAMIELEKICRDSRLPINVYNKIKNWSLNHSNVIHSFQGRKGDLERKNIYEFVSEYFW